MEAVGFKLDVFHDVEWHQCQGEEDQDKDIRVVTLKRRLSLLSWRGHAAADIICK